MIRADRRDARPAAVRGARAVSISDASAADRLSRLVVRGWYGLAARSRRAASVLGSPDELRVFSLPIPDAIPCDIEPPPGVAFAAVSAEDVLRCPLRYSSSRTNAENCLAGNGTCYAGTSGGEVVFRMWTVALDQAALGRLAPGLEGRALFVHESWTHPDARGRGIYPAALSWLAGHCIGAFDFIVLTVTHRNTPAIRAATKAGFREWIAATRAALDGEGGVPTSGAPARAITGTAAVPPAGLLGIVRDVLRLRDGVWIVGTGRSMHPTLRHGEAVAVERPGDRVRSGMIVLLEGGGGPVIHRVVALRPGAVYTRGDAAIEGDGWTSMDRVLGVAIAKAPVTSTRGFPTAFRLIGDMTLHTRVPRTTALVPTFRFGAAAFLRYVQYRTVFVLRRARLRAAFRRRRNGPATSALRRPVPGSEAQ